MRRKTKSFTLNEEVISLIEKAAIEEKRTHSQIVELTLIDTLSKKDKDNAQSTNR